MSMTVDVDLGRLDVTLEQPTVDVVVAKSDLVQAFIDRPIPEVFVEQSPIAVVVRRPSIDITVENPGGGTGPQGIPGPQGPPGSDAIYVGPTPPSDTTLLWFDTS